MEEKKVLLFSSRLPQRGKTKAFWEDVFKNMADIFYSKTLTDVMQNIKLQIFSSDREGGADCQDIGPAGAWIGPYYI